MTLATIACAFVMVPYALMGQAATDNDLFAGYCVGVESEIQKGGPDMLRRCDQLLTSQQADCRGLVYDLSAKSNERLGRLRRFLAARGYLNIENEHSFMALEGIDLARRSGISDSQQCSNDVLKCAGPDYSAGSLRQCAGVSQACVRKNRCNDLSRLPF